MVTLFDADRSNPPNVFSADRLLSLTGDNDAKVEPKKKDEPKKDECWVLTYQPRALFAFHATRPIEAVIADKRRATEAKKEATEAKKEATGEKSKWECPVCCVMNDADKCVCCTEPRPAKARPTTTQY